MSSRGAQLALLSACIGAITLNTDKLSTVASGALTYTGGAYLVVALTSFVGKTPEGGWSRIRVRDLLLMVGLGVLLGLCAALMNAGYFYAIVPYVGALKRTVILWAVVFAVFFLQEKYGGTRMVGSAIIFAGVVLIAF